MKWVEIGKIPRTHGLRGEFKFQPFVTEPDILQNLDRLKLLGNQGQEIELKFESLRGNPRKLIIKFKDIDSIEDAEAYTGQTVLAQESVFKKLPDGEYYWHQVIGLDVYDENDRHYGQIVEIIETGSNDVYVVRDGEKEILLPMIDWVVKTIDIEKKKLIFDNVEGLIEDSTV